MTTQRSDKDSPEIRSLDGQIVQAEAQGRWPQAAQLLRSRAQRIAPPAEQARTLEHLVSVYRVKLGDERGAMQAAEELLALDASHAGARHYLVESYTRQGNAARAQQLQASAPSGGGIFGAISNAFGSATAAVGAAASGAATAVVAGADRGDEAQCGRGGRRVIRRRSCTDSDGGRFGDRPGFGRRCR